MNLWINQKEENNETARFNPFFKGYLTIKMEKLMDDKKIEYFLIYLRKQIQTLGEIGKLSHRHKGFISSQLRDEIDQQLMELSIKKNYPEIF